MLCWPSPPSWFEQHLTVDSVVLQGPSASAYITYLRSEDALRAIQAVNNIHVDGRTLKASLGTTKYCSHFLRGTQCPKPVSLFKILKLFQHFS